MYMCVCVCTLPIIVGKISCPYTKIGLGLNPKPYKL